MSSVPTSFRVLVVGDARSLLSGKDVLRKVLPPAWEVVPVENLLQANVHLQHREGDVLLLRESADGQSGSEVLAWLIARHQVPAVVLTACPSAAKPALPAESGCWRLGWLAGTPAPAMLGEVLQQAARWGQLQRARRCLEEALSRTCRQSQRLSCQLAAAQEAAGLWLSQEQVLACLEAEVRRAQRYRQPVTVLIGEIRGTRGSLSQLRAWIAEQLRQHKRRCDVAGQYGARGFLLVLANTPAEGGQACRRRLERTLQQAAGRQAGQLRLFFGLAAAPNGELAPQQLLQQAEAQLHTALSEEQREQASSAER